MIHISNVRVVLDIRMCSMLNLFCYLHMQVQCGDVELERKIDEKIEQFIDKVEKHPNKKNQVQCDKL